MIFRILYFLEFTADFFMVIKFRFTAISSLPLQFINFQSFSQLPCFNRCHHFDDYLTGYFFVLIFAYLR